MLVKFRYHRGSFDDSMQTTVTFSRADQLEFMLLQREGASKEDRIRIEYYGYDNRLPADTFIVSDSKGPIGFMWFEEKTS